MNVTITVIVMGVLAVLTLGIGALFAYMIIKNSIPVEDLDTQALKDEVKSLQESVDQLYEDYQDIGRMFFDLREKADTVIEICKKSHKTKESKALAEIIINTLKEKENEKGK